MKHVAKYAALAIVAMGFVVVGSSSARAQGSYEAGAGYQYQWLKASGDDQGTNFPGGFYVKFGGMINDKLDWVADVDASKAKQDDGGFWASVYEGGVSYKIPAMSSVKPYVAGLLGGAHVSDGIGNGFALDLLGGAKIPMSGGSYDLDVFGGYRFVRISSQGNSENVNGFRFGVGATFPLGK